MGPKTSATPIERVFGAMTLQETLSTDDYHPRPGYGKVGKVIRVEANMFQARFKNQGTTVQHYDIEINPVVKATNQKKPKTLLWAVWKQLCEEATGPFKAALDAAAFDTVKNIYTPNKIPLENGRKEVIVSLKEDGKDAEDDKRRFKVQIQHAQEIDLDTIMDFCKKNKQTEAAKEIMLVAIQAMNVLFRQRANDQFKAVGAQGRRYFGTANSVPLPNGGVVYSGFMQSFRWTESGYPAMQLDTAYSAFLRPGRLDEVIMDVLGMGGGGGGRGRGGFDRGGPRGGRGGPGGPPGGGAPQSLDPRSIKRLNDVLRMAKFTVTHRKTSRVFTMRGLTVQAAADLKFLLTGRDGAQDRMVSIVDYYKEMYNVQVTKPRLPCVAYGQRNYVPLEFVRLEEFNSIPMMRLTADQTAEMIKVAAKPPPQRAQMIRDWRQTLDYSNLPKVRAWGVEVNANMMQLNARVLQPPAVQYGAGKSQRPNFGSWNLRDTKFCKAGKPLKSWSVLSYDDRADPQMIQGFVGKLVQVLRKSNCPVENERPAIVSHNPNAGGPFGGIKAGLQDAARAAYMQSKANPQMILILLPRKELPLYQEIKRCAAQDLKLPLVTQCLQTQKCRPDNRGLEQYLGNVSMKIHSKMGGLTHVVPVSSALDKTTMMVGADVTHPPPRGGPIPPSIAVTVSAIDGENAQFVPSIRLQEGRVEIISDLAGMMKTHIELFQKNTGSKPAKIIMFRDGVSEGQYGHCAEIEFNAMLQAARDIDPKYRPKITFVVCAKRHNMRFFGLNQGDLDRTGNLPAGTVVDTTITHPFAFDFFLQAHAGLQGTARPTHYIVVKDEIGFDADKMQGLCNALCYSYARATRSVSIVPVAYYADIIATKCRDLVYNDDSSDGGAGSVSDMASGRKETQAFDSLALKKRIEDATEYNSVAWYM
ncbi:eukaryotic translation initiation factor 2C 2 [Dioszegia hungarica]|uniref:Eukaryotic translation initiation factor 2C 2 n=1 Tax=Dioszegia hungarica TaxID=4972 RepID=A0AA38H912_9TREE|nr:eukaryotic translation initiation factor 2C 2 [Dioszegia hungarica]KAI9636400.1 eukaryotic translation initiation factor 2C 2 [Dioszegia hungarica]